MAVTTRFIEPQDFETFAKWAVDNPNISGKDIQAAVSNPTTTTLVVEKDGKVLMYLPFYCAGVICYCGFNPEASKKERYQALEEVVPAMTKFLNSVGVKEIYMSSSPDYKIAQYAEKRHGFKPEDRTTYVLHTQNVEVA